MRIAKVIVTILALHLHTTLAHRPVLNIPKMLPIAAAPIRPNVVVPTILSPTQFLKSK